MLRSVAVVALDQVAAFELGVLAEVFGTDRTADGFPGYQFAVCTVDGGPVQTGSGFHLTPHADLGPIEHADLVAVPAHGKDGAAVPPPVLDALRRAATRGAYVMSVCSGAFVLGEAGLLDDRECTTHWRHVDELQRRNPRARVRCNSLYVADGRLLTSAGTAAGIDACLHLVRQEHGSATATRLARRMVVPPHRDGGQSQYVEAPIPKAPEAPTLEPVLAWLMGRLDRPVTVDDLAARAGMSPRTFARRFRAETGTTPHDWLTNQRVLLARRLLEETGLSVESVAGRAGFGDAAALRHHFTRRVGTTPNAYRATFRDRIGAH
ncbi:GlxA family transcriptional regulator [Micromonospora sp. NPDC048830]|uniref:GlxA family transcriptional regulator n=1 Tax=Micromonospora sp. NPDC048830 TaxID=3364257 RepID=UPI003713B25D